MDAHSNKSEHYRNIMKNSKPIKEVQKKANVLQGHLPPIIFEKRSPVRYVYSSNSLDSGIYDFVEI